MLKNSTAEGAERPVEDSKRDLDCAERISYCGPEEVHLFKKYHLIRSK